MDAFSRLVFLRVQKSKQSADSLKSLKLALKFFTSHNPHKSYKLFAADDGGEWKRDFKVSHTHTHTHTHTQKDTTLSFYGLQADHHKTGHEPTFLKVVSIIE